MIILGIGYIAFGLFVAGEFIVERRWHKGSDNVFCYLLLIISLIAAGVVHLFA